MADGGDDIQGGGINLQGIGIVEVLWKKITGIFNRQLLSYISFHDVMHGFCAGRGTGIVTLEAKLLQQITDMREAVLHSILLNLLKSYDALDMYRCLDILSGYSMGNRTIHTPQTYWARIQMTSKAGGHYGTAFQRHRGVTQGDPLSTKILTWLLTLSCFTG